MANIIERRFWKRDDNRTVSIYGAAPWTSETEKSRWEIITEGFTVQWKDGTVGGYKCAWKTREEAETFLLLCPRAIQENRTPEEIAAFRARVQIID